jgi:hypothetical protein
VPNDDIYRLDAMWTTDPDFPDYRDLAYDCPCVSNREFLDPRRPGYFE